MTPRRLTKNVDDLEAYVDLRRAMPADAPWAYLASPEDDIGCDRRKLGTELSKSENVIFVIEAPSEEAHESTQGLPSPGFGGSPSLVFTAAAGAVRDFHIKTAHKAIIWGVYVIPSMRRKGLGRAVLSASLEEASAWEGIEVLTLSASTNAPEAIGLYESMGFERWGDRAQRDAGGWGEPWRGAFSEGSGE